jgi:hypothetical protein
MPVTPAGAEVSGTGRLAGTASRASELAADGRALGVADDGLPAVQLAAMIAAAAATS